MRAVTVPYVGELNLTDVARGDGYLFVREGVGIAGRGVAARVPIDEAVEFLAAIDHHDRVGETPGPIAIGAVPFLPGSSADLIIPAVMVGRDASGRQWTTTIDDIPLDSVSSPTHPTPTSRSWTIGSDIDIDHYLTAVMTARDEVAAGNLRKAVIARPIRVSADGPIDLHAVLRRLEATFRTSYRFSIDGFIGASPELLVSVNGTAVSSFPLAGTTRTTGDDELDARLAAELHRSPKNRIEHAAAIEMVRDTLLPYCSYLDWTPSPEIVKVANVQHLGSRAEGMLSRPTATVIDLVRALQPTPAVGGYPRDDAIEVIRRVEGFERGLYGGAVGWCDGSGNGTWAVSLRCAEFSDDRCSARLVAGGGIVADSAPVEELAETQAKFQAMLGAIVRP
ncbi:MAG: isochorismate synthase [Ilumatobacter coccineus]|uniref:isochorismate synthase n=1 Tax=Ilumatobacter coccineus TaxID=467094 RepID=A0A2G6KE34_9ACTN|nr:MAG: isochorismate synthase [Ilumatobacter coccineus]